MTTTPEPSPFASREELQSELRELRRELTRQHRRTTRRTLLIAVVVSVTAVPWLSHAVDELSPFVANTPIKAADINHHFETLRSAIIAIEATASSQGERLSAVEAVDTSNR